MPSPRHLSATLNVLEPRRLRRHSHHLLHRQHQLLLRLIRHQHHDGPVRKTLSVLLKSKCLIIEGIDCTPSTICSERCTHEPYALSTLKPPKPER